MLMQDYFSYVPTYPSSLFCRRYQMRWQLYLKIGLACKANCRYFTRRRNGIGTIGFSAFHERCVHGNLFSHGRHSGAHLQTGGIPLAVMPLFICNWWPSK
jgi:hypothetical protein